MVADLVIPTAIRALRAVVRKGIAAVRDRIPQAGHDIASLEPALARNSQRLHPVARIRQQQQASNSGYNHSTNFSRYYSTYPNGTARKTPVRSAVSKVSKSTPFASTLRPKLFGALPRSANGYSLGGNARYFSHSTAPAQVIQQVSTAMRAFVLSGKDVGYYSAKRRNNTNTYARGQIKMHLAAANTDRFAPGAYVDFRMLPNFTCMSETDPVGYTCLDSTRGGFMDELDVELNNVMRDISRVYQDIRKLSSLGELPITLVPPATLRVHFRGCDADLVNALCDEVGVITGIIHEDERFAYDKLLDGGALQKNVDTVNWREMMSSDDDEDTDWEKYSSIPSHEINNPIIEILSQGNAAPHWDEEAEDFYDEIDPGGSSGSEFLFSKEEYMNEGGGYVNPWVMPVGNGAGAF